MKYFKYEVKFGSNEQKYHTLQFRVVQQGSNNSRAISSSGIQLCTIADDSEPV